MHLRHIPALLAALVLALTVLLGSPSSRAIGDRIQIALPVIGAACAASRGDLGDFAGRLAGSLAVVHGSKGMLGDSALNRRPNGHGGGFPSGHTAAAAYGASYLLRSCGAAVPYVGPVLVLAAGFVGGSRLAAGRHDLPQVMAGAVIGIGFDRGLRSPASRRRLRDLLRRGRAHLAAARIRIQPTRPRTG